MVDDWTASPTVQQGCAHSEVSTEEVAAYMATGRNAHAVANGEMASVVEHSLQHMSDSDLKPWRVFLKTMDGQAVEAVPAKLATPGPRSMAPLPADEAGQATAVLLKSASPAAPLGARLYLDTAQLATLRAARVRPRSSLSCKATRCGAGQRCQSTGGPDSANGTASLKTDRRPMDLVMQGYADRLTDSEVAALATFAQGLGQPGSEVSESQGARYASMYKRQKKQQIQDFRSNY